MDPGFGQALRMNFLDFLREDHLQDESIQERPPVLQEQPFSPGDTRRLRGACSSSILRSSISTELA